MNKSIRRYVVSAGVILVCAGALLIFLINRGVPAVDVSAYVPVAAEAVQTSELKLGAGDPRLQGMRLAAQTEALSLYYHPETTEFAVLDRRSDKLWHSNPAEREADPIATPYEKETLGSQFTLTFRDQMGRITTFTNAKESVARGQFEAEAIEGGFRVTYTLGDAELGIDALPKFISAARMEERVLSQLDEAQAKYVSARYLPKKDDPETLERLDTAVARDLVLKRMIAAFEEAGYTAEDLQADNETAGIGGGAVVDRPRFVIPLHVRLEGETLVVTVPSGEIEEHPDYKLRMLNLLGFFGAAGPDEEGYMLVPDGTGSLIYLNNGKLSQELYAQRVYGQDENDNIRRRGQIAESVRLPVFGIKSGDYAWYATIEQGDAIATIQADIAGRNNSYNQNFASFALRGEDLLELYKGTTVEEIQLLTEERYAGDLTVRYHFLAGEEADYSGMARHYRSELERRGVLTPLTGEDRLPMFVSVLGAIDKRKTVLGVPYRGLVPMTTFDQAADIAGRLQADGVQAIEMRYLGWFNEGLSHEIPARVKIDGKLGGRSDLRELAGMLEAGGGRLYPDVAFQHVYQTDGRFSPSADAARFITREEALRNPYNRALNRMDRNLGDYYLLSPIKLPYYVDRFLDSYADVGVGGLSLRDLGDKVHADYRAGRVVFRETAKTIAEAQLAKLSEQHPELLLSGGNAYALGYAARFVDVPVGTSGFGIADETVPFYQMVLHGYADYAGAAMNLSEEQDMRRQLLQTIELGAAPHYLWTHEPSSTLKFTPYDTMYSTSAEDWYVAALELYQRTAETLAPLRAVRMEQHLRHGEGVSEVRYENGVSLYINYTDRPVTVEGVAIPAQDFIVGGERG
ncbi:hypothetical protein PA598K_04629 [Paenibacillus sp. 598K]|uniref:DUF5696 domain-containing protein n=1 Tax=Paenibacillus sp. 598K TaxID=1117987 RepID=UPI000FFAA920|nr:DUF5696 domain-containing protein [Paenibacillus sp. 598K]GBF76181.1 hypothetical protein PA598K_04629 [Paenibacillus sp. 598K]